MEHTYYQEPRRLPFGVQYGWGRLLLVTGVLAAIGGYLWLTHGRSEQTTTVEPYTQHVEKLSLVPKKDDEPAGVPDPRIAELLRRQQEQDAENARLRAMLESLAKRPAPKEAVKAHGAATKPVAKTHRDMGYLAFAVPEDAPKEEPRYVLAPGDTKIACTVESKQHSEVESIGTVKVTANIWDTDTRRQLLIPQGSTIVVKYQSANLRYGNQRLPEHTSTLTFPNGKVVELHEEPVMDQVGQAGLVTRVQNHFWRAVPAVLIQGVLRGSQATMSSINPFAAGMAGSAAQYGQRQTQPYIDMRPTIEVDPGEECMAILTRELRLPAYRERSK